MSWSVGYDERWKRDIGYGVPATCDHPGCGVEIDRGLSFVCGGQPYGGDHGCGLYFCMQHRRTAGAVREHAELCQRCYARVGRFNRPPFAPTPDRPEWIAHKLTDESWSRWRKENPEAVAKLSAQHKGG